MNGVHTRRGSSHEVIVGLMVLIGIAVFVGGGLWLRGKKVGAPDVQVVFTDIGNLKEGAPVRISGAPVGRVVDVHFDTVGQVTVGLKLSSRAMPSTNARARIVSIGMLGDQMIDFDPGAGPPLPKGTVIRGTMEKGVMEKGTELAEKASEVMTNLNAMLDKQLIVDFRRSLANMSKLMAYLADEKKGPTSQVNATMLALQSTSARLDSTLKAIDPKALETRIDTTLRATTKLMDRLTLVSAHADSLMQKLQRGDGTMGKLMNDSTLYTDLHRTLVSFQRLVDELAKNPGKSAVTVRIP